MVSGNPRAGELLDWLQRSTTMLRYDGIERFVAPFPTLFENFKKPIAFRGNMWYSTDKLNKTNYYCRKKGLTRPANGRCEAAFKKQNS